MSNPTTTRINVMYKTTRDVHFNYKDACAAAKELSKTSLTPQRVFMEHPSFRGDMLLAVYSDGRKVPGGEDVRRVLAHMRDVAAKRGQ